MTDKPKIVVLDGYTLNPGDQSWEELKSIGECEIHDRTSPDEVLSRSGGAPILLTNKTILDRNIIEALPDLRYIGVMATGYNVVDFEAANERRIPVTNVPEYATESVVQMVFALLLEMTQHVGHHSETVRNGQWAASPDFCYWDKPLIELSGLTIGIVGYGRIGRAVAEVALAFGMKVLVYDIEPAISFEKNITFVDPDDVFEKSDIVSLHCPLTSESQGIVNAKQLALMKRTAFLINTGRGPLVNEHDLAEALNSEKIAGAGLDVLSVEPPCPDNPLINAKNCFITPHIAWATLEARKRLMKVVVENIRAFLSSEPVNVVNDFR
ncbi:MAG: D-2-hydroxyacid dehydrogenase [Candidatus Latescibacteria bacterium]|nr:D-2-hydroxyacid dehydrogenase [Candidatus Latescibacterota bacterium]